MTRTPLRVALFCGGRGSATIIREFARRPDIELSLLINAYDDGLSTGALRDFISGMLGPSDFRKNLSYLVDPHSPQQYAMQHLLEYRFPAEFGAGGLGLLTTFAEGTIPAGFPPPLATIVRALSPLSLGRMRSLVGSFARYASEREPLDYTDFSFGNILFAGAYLQSGHDFNGAVREMGTLFQSQATLLNVSRGEARTLAALKADGRLLAAEADIVSPQDDVPIANLFMLERRLTSAERAEFDLLGPQEREAWLREREFRVEISPEAARAIAEADIIVYGPGTQHSSLFPSYRIAGPAIRAGASACRVLVANLRFDHDIQGFNTTKLFERALQYLGDPDNAAQTVSHVLCNRWTGTPPADALTIPSASGDEPGSYLHAELVWGAYANPGNTHVHNGRAVVAAILQAYERTRHKAGLDIYVDLRTRSLALDGIIHEFNELAWPAAIGPVTLRINSATQPSGPLRPESGIEVANLRLRGFSEVAVLLEWLRNRETEYLATITGDGQYRLDDILRAINFLDDTQFGATYGSRNQSRRQFQLSLRSAYGEGSALYGISRAGAFVLSLIFGLRLGIIFSAPLTGFRVYRRSRLSQGFLKQVAQRPPTTAASITRILVGSGTEIAELPVTYRTYAGFTTPAWRLQRGLRNLLGIFF